MKKYLVLLFLLGCAQATTVPPKVVTIEQLPSHPIAPVEKHLVQSHFILDKDIEEEVELLQYVLQAATNLKESSKWFIYEDLEDIVGKIDAIIGKIHSGISEEEMTEKVRLINEYYTVLETLKLTIENTQFKVHELDVQFYKLPK